MGIAPSVLERSVLHAGKVFIHAGEDSSRAYVIQDGCVVAFTIGEDNEEIEVSRFGAGAIIGEFGLVTDQPMHLNYKAITNTTVVTVTRQDFQKKLAKTDKSVVSILEHTVHKIGGYETAELHAATERAIIDETAYVLVKHLVSDIRDDEKKEIYMNALAPSINDMIKTIKTLKQGDTAQI